MPTKCKQTDCRRDASYNYPGQTSRLYCSDHKLDSMVNMKKSCNLKCIIPGCSGRAYYNYPNNSRAQYCPDHRESGMVNTYTASKKAPSTTIHTTTATPTAINTPSSTPNTTTHTSPRTTPPISDVAVPPSLTTLSDFIRNMYIPENIKTLIDPDSFARLTENVPFKFPEISPALVDDSIGKLAKYVPKYDPDTSVLASSSVGSTGINSFVLKNMMSSYNKKYLSLINIWSSFDSRKKLWSNVLKSDRPGPVTSMYIVNTYGYRYGRVYNFPATVAKEVYTYFGNLVMQNINRNDTVRILDPCAGFCGRLFGYWFSLSDDVSTEYVGVDPNTEIPYSTVIEYLTSTWSNGNRSAKVINSPFEDLDTSTLGTFDIIFTSPPYYDCEIYSSDDTQSSVRYSTYESWLDQFLFVMLDSCIQLLNPGGFLIINMKNIQGYSIAIDMCEYLRNTDLVELNTIKFCQPNKHSTKDKDRIREYFYCYQKMKE